jgi:two-component system sensor histidine kinase KdpD
MAFSFATLYNPEGNLKPLNWPRVGAAQSRGRAAHKLRRKLVPALPGGLALAGVAVCTWLSFRLDQSFAFTGFLHLVIVVLAAVYGGFWQATAVSVAAVACLNYFFVPPIFSFANSPANWVALGAFEFTAVVISRLSLRANLRAMEAIAKRRETERLYETSRRILLLDSSGEPENHITSLIRETFEIQAVRLFDALPATTYQSGDGPPEAEQRTRDAYFLDTDTFDPQTRSWYCVLRLGTRPVGGLALHDTDMTKLAATALASLSAIVLERVRARQREFRAQAARQTEQLRTAVLDALAHQFRHP